MDLKTDFILWNMILKLKSFIQISTVIFSVETTILCVAVYFFDETRYSTSIYHLVTQFWRYSQTCLNDHLYINTSFIRWPRFSNPFAMIFKYIEPVFSDLLSYVTLFYSSLEGSHKTELTVQYSQILSGRIDFISVNERIQLVVYPIQFSGRLNDTFFCRSVFYRSLSRT